MNNKKNTRILVLLLGLTAMTLTANNLNAQNGGGLFGRGATSSDYATNSSKESLLGAGSPTIGGSITNDDFQTPIGSGIAILMGAGLGYAALKKKEDKQ